MKPLDSISSQRWCLIGPPVENPTLKTDLKTSGVSRIFIEYMQIARLHIVRLLKLGLCAMLVLPAANGNHS
jgi:hypothetical protein